MTLREMAVDRISLLPEANVRVVLAMVDEMLRQNGEMMKSTWKKQNDIEEGRAAFREIIEMRKQSPFPADFDYDKAREEAMIEKYGSFD